MFFELNGSDLVGKSDWTGVEATNLGTPIPFLEGVNISLDSPTGAYVGTFSANVVGGPSRTLTYTLLNDTSLTSLTGRVFGDISYNRIPYWGAGFLIQPLSTISQTYSVKESY